VDELGSWSWPGGIGRFLRRGRKDGKKREADVGLGDDGLKRTLESL